VNGVEQSGSGLIQGIPSGSSRTFYYSGSTARNYQVRIHDPGVGSTTVGPASAGPCGTVVTPVSCNISATPSSITAGGSSTLQWNTTGSPTGASINNGVGSVNVTSGTRSVSPSSTTTYTLTVSKSGVPNATCSRTVTVVNEPAPTPVSCSLTANPPVINPGGSSTLTWTTGGSPTSATINQGVGSVSPPAGGSRGVSPGGTTNYTLIVSKSGVPNANCSATVTIDACPNIPGNQVNTNGYIVDGLGNCQAYDEPYFRVFGGDVSVGGEFQSSTGCTTNSGAGILAFNNHPSGAGSAGQLAAFAMNHIVGFTSATGRIADPRPARGLSFSNTAGDSTYGGSFGTASCPADYFSKEIDPSYTITDLAGGTDTLTSVSVANGSKVVYKKSAGSLVINGSGINFGSTNWSNVGEIPSVYVIVDGDIYIDPSVTQLDGIYIARGSIYTCAPGASTYSAAALATAGCGNKLTVNGSFIAKQVKLLRTGGDIGSSTLTETPASPSVAEVFTYSPEVFFHSPFVRPEPYQSITNLPPVL